VSEAIRPIALGVVRRGCEILVFDADDSVKDLARGHVPIYPDGLGELVADSANAP